MIFSLYFHLKTERQLDPGLILPNNNNRQAHVYYCVTGANSSNIFVGEMHTNEINSAAPPPPPIRTSHLHMPEMMGDISNSFLRQASRNADVDEHVRVPLVGVVSQAVFENFLLLLVPRRRAHL